MNFCGLFRFLDVLDQKYWAFWFLIATAEAFCTFVKLNQSELESDNQNITHIKFYKLVKNKIKSVQNTRQKTQKILWIILYETVTMF